MFICVNYYYTKNIAPLGAMLWAGGLAMVAALAATYITPNGILDIHSALH